MEIAIELNLECIIKSDHKLEHNVWNPFSMKKLGDYYDIYVQIYCVMCMKMLQTWVLKLVILTQLISF